jgi:hypothetical protein
MSLFGYRLVGAALLDRSIYEGIEADRGALGQALAAVLLSSVAAGIGATDWHGPSLASVLVVAAIAVVTWVAWAMLMLQIGGRLFRTKATSTSLTELMRTIGFAASPGLLQVFGAFPRMAVPVFVVAWLWMLVATVVAVRQALDFTSTVRAVLVCVTAGAVCLGAALVLSWAMGPALAPA